MSATRGPTSSNRSTMPGRSPTLVLGSRSPKLLQAHIFKHIEEN
jgi:hypothetical protein